MHFIDIYNVQFFLLTPLISSLKNLDNTLRNCFFFYRKVESNIAIKLVKCWIKKLLREMFWPRFEWKTKLGQPNSSFCYWNQNILSTFWFWFVYKLTLLFVVPIKLQCITSIIDMFFILVNFFLYNPRYKHQRLNISWDKNVNMVPCPEMSGRHGCVVVIIHWGF